MGGHLLMLLYLIRFSTNGFGISTWMTRFGRTQPYTLVMEMLLGGCMIPPSKQVFELSYNWTAVTKRVRAWRPRWCDGIGNSADLR